MTDPIADMLTRIRNAQMAGIKHVEIPFSKIKRDIANLLVKEGYVLDVKESGESQRLLVIGLKYEGRKPYIQSIKRESKPGHRVYKKSTEMPKVLNGYGIAIVSTSHGLMTNKEAREKGVGGEVICSVY